MTAGGVMMESEYDDAGGLDRADGEGTVTWSRRRIVTLGERGLIGVAGRE